MLNQSYSSKNFKEVFEAENKKGNFIEGRYFPEIEKLSIRIKDCNQAMRRLRRRFNEGRISQKTCANRIELIKRIKLNYANDREKIIVKHMDGISDSVSKKGFSIGLESGQVINGKSTYKISDSPESYFAMKQLQKNIEMSCNVKPFNRDQVILQVKSILSGTFPLYVVKADFSSFYEGIDQKKLLEFLDGSSELSFTSRRFISQIISQYNNLSGSNRGIPRGAGVSAYLAELYMMEFDESVKAIPDIIYYARYVDDIIAIFSVNDSSVVSYYAEEIRNKAACYGLVMNPEKTALADLRGSTSSAFDYLGYKFVYSGRSLSLQLVDKKLSEYRKRIDLCFDEYLSRKSLSVIRRRKLLIDRIRFMTGNVKLYNSKKSVMVGIYYSHKHIDSVNQFDGLDNYLRSRIAKHVTDPSLSRRLNKLSFREGFFYRSFRKFSSSRIGDITSVWKYA